MLPGVGLPTSLTLGAFLDRGIVDGDFEMSLKNKLKARKPAQVDVAFCMDRPLIDELRQAQAEDRGADGAYSGGKSKKVRELEKAVRDATFTMRVFSVPRDVWTQTMVDHPPRPEYEGEMFNAATFYAAVAQATAVEVTATGTVPIPEDDWAEFIDGLTDGEYDRLASAVMLVNRDLSPPEVAPLG